MYAPAIPDSGLSVKRQGFGYKLPPFYVTIREILDRYPDGQIFKVWLTVIIRCV